MSDLADPWGAYERLQQKLSKKDRLDAEAWGFEAALNAIVEAVAAGATPADDEIARTAATAARAERYRAKLRLVFLQADEPSPQRRWVRLRSDTPQVEQFFAC